MWQYSYAGQNEEQWFTSGEADNIASNNIHNIASDRGWERPDNFQLSRTLTSEQVAELGEPGADATLDGEGDWDIKQTEREDAETLGAGEVDQETEFGLFDVLNNVWAAITS